MNTTLSILASLTPLTLVQRYKVACDYASILADLTRIAQTKNFPDCLWVDMERKESDTGWCPKLLRASLLKAIHIHIFHHPLMQAAYSAAHAKRETRRQARELVALRYLSQCQKMHRLINYRQKEVREAHDKRILSRLVAAHQAPGVSMGDNLPRVRLARASRAWLTWV